MYTGIFVSKELFVQVTPLEQFKHYFARQEQALKKLQGKRSPTAYVVSKRQEIKRLHATSCCAQYKWLYFSCVASAPKAKQQFFPEC